MIEMLHIENIAVIEKADIEFGEGLNVFTGETGAGKSIVIDALSAVCGGRVSREIVRTESDAAVVTAVFSDTLNSDWYDVCGVNRDEDGKIFLMRRVSADGKNVCRVNGVPVSVAQLRELGAMLIDIHGQNDGRKLLDETAHLKYLDAYAGLHTEIAQYKLQYAKLRELRNQLNELTMDEGEKARRIDTLKYQIEEIESADIKAGELGSLNERRDMLVNASKLTESVDMAFEALYGGDSDAGAVSLISDAQSNIERATRFSSMLAPISARLRDLQYTAQDLSEELRDIRESLDFSPEELDELELRLALISRITRKYGDEEETEKYLVRARAELDEIEFSDQKRQKLESEIESCLKTALVMAVELSEKRKSAAQIMEKRIMEELSLLNMSGVQFKAVFEEVSGTPGLDGTGCDSVRFLMSANAGEAPGRISHIASGGELSRIMLALKNVLTENDETATMVFDEVDAGVSGIAAQRVGEKLSDLAGRRQVLCVTHLPQIAAMADEAFEIHKTENSGRTFTAITKLDSDGRKQELARLIGGENVTVTTLSSAAELLEAAKKHKQS